MSSKTREREPDLIQFRIEHMLDEDLPVESFFMAKDANDAIKMLARSCLKYLVDRNLSNLSVDCFVNAYANPRQPFLEQPEMVPVLETLPEFKGSAEDITKNEFPELKQEENLDSEECFVESNSEKSEEHSTPDPFKDSNAEEEKKIKGKTSNEDNIFAAASEEPKPDPAVEHAMKKKARDEEIIQAKLENERRRNEFESLRSIALQQVDELNEKLSILQIDEHNRWSDEWVSVPYPLIEQDVENEELPQE
jgi:hypothetical protein